MVGIVVVNMRILIESRRLVVGVFRRDDRPWSALNPSSSRVLRIPLWNLLLLTWLLLIVVRILSMVQLMMVHLRILRMGMIGLRLLVVAILWRLMLLMLLTRQWRGRIGGRRWLYKRRSGRGWGPGIALLMRRS